MSASRHEKLAEVIFEDVSADLANFTLAQITEALDAIHEYDPNAIGFMEKVLSTGPQSARDAAAYKLSSITENIAEALETGESWLDRCSRTLGSELVNSVMSAWSVQCVIEEYRDVEAYRITMWADKARFALRIDDLELTQHPVSFEDWRGLAALGAVRIEGSSPEQIKGFIRYAGPAQELTIVIDTARERGTLDPVAVDAVINGSNASALRSGAL